DVEPPHLANSTKARQQFVADFRPRPRGHLAAPVCREAFGDDLAVPVGDRDILRMLGEMIPERLNVFELLVRRELVEATRRKRRLRHDSSIPASSAFADATPCDRQQTGVRREEKRSAALTRARVRPSSRADRRSSRAFLTPFAFFFFPFAFKHP